MSKNQETFKPMELTYHQEGEFLTPDIKPLTPPSREIGKYGNLRNQYLKEFKPDLLMELIFDDKINEHLEEVDQAAQRRLELIMEGMMKNHPAPDKKTRPMEWAGHMSNLQHLANEIVLSELIYN
ncbi:TnpV protein [Acetobacterium sp.]|uniref:TnpV protein n=1 Tax=Acetobacterium sp. TaxID=1872094 RepID=UPI00351D298B